MKKQKKRKAMGAPKKRNKVIRKLIERILPPQDNDIVFDVLKSPFENSTNEERAESINLLGKNASEGFEQSIRTLHDAAKAANPFTAISILSHYLTITSVSKTGQQEGLVNKSQTGQAHAELYQALALRVPIEEISPFPPKPQIMQDMFDALEKASLSFAFKRLASTDLEKTEEQLAVRGVQEWVRQRTQIVRNWGYFEHVYQILNEIYTPNDELYFRTLGFNVSSALSVFRYMVDEAERRLNNRWNNLRRLAKINNPVKLVHEYHQLIGLNKEKAEEFCEGLDVSKRKTKEVFAMVLSHYDILLQEQYTFTYDELMTHSNIDEVHLEKIIEKFSYSLGGLVEKKLEHIFLDNPIWKRPIIKKNDRTLFCALPQVFFSFALSTLHEILPQNEQAILSSYRATYLEQKIEEIVKTRFPQAETVRGLKWKSDNIEYETDLITFIDSHALIIEAKSGKISAEALRGAPNSLREELSELLFAPNIQSNRLKQLLLDLIKNPSREHPIREKLPVNLEKIHKVLRVSVSLEDFATVQANIKGLEKTGWLPENFEPCPTMCLGDFQILFDVLEHPVQIIHYLGRREELEKTVRYFGDEIDLLGWYLDTLLNTQNFGDEFDQIVISGLSKPIDNYYTTLGTGLSLKKPTPKIHPLFQEILKQLEVRKTPRWTEIGSLLHMFLPKDQLKLFQLLPSLRRTAGKDWKRTNYKNMLILHPEPPSEVALCYIYFQNENAHLRNNYIEAGMSYGLEPEHIKYCLAIAKNLNSERAYDFLGLTGKD